MNKVCRKCNLKGYYQNHYPIIEEKEEKEVKDEYHLQVEDSDYIIESDSNDDAYYYQAICLMLKQLMKNLDIL